MFLIGNKFDMLKIFGRFVISYVENVFYIIYYYVFCFELRDWGKIWYVICYCEINVYRIFDV